MIVGDVVYLKSGSRAMTVIALDADGTVRVVWDGGQGSFPAACLVSENPTFGIAKKNRELEKANADPVEAR